MASTIPPEGRPRTAAMTVGQRRRVDESATGAIHGHLRVCANSDSVDGVLDYLPVSADVDRERYAAVGRALADPKRLYVLESLAIGELSVSDLSLRVGCQVPNMSQHLAVLRHAGLVTSRRDGNTILYRLADPRVLEAYRLIQDLAR
jgi:DNA-binding transcriptional ArsR family regulator